MNELYFKYFYEKMLSYVACVMLLLSTFVSCKSTFKNYGEYIGCCYLYVTFFSDNTFISKIEGDKLNFGYDTSSGTWFQKGKYLYLNSYRKPQNEKYFLVKEAKSDTIESGITYLKVSTGPFFWQPAINDSVMVFFNEKIHINNDLYIIPYNGQLRIKNKKILSIEYSTWATDYTKYFVRNKQSNYFYIEAVIPENYDDCFPSDSYFDNAKIKINGKELKHGNKVLRKR